jgi:hypothetical protein
MDTTDKEIKEYTKAFAKSLMPKIEWDKMTMQNLYVIWLSLLMHKRRTISDDEIDVYSRCMDYVRNVRIRCRN